MSLFRRNEWHSAGAQINSAWYSTRVQRTSTWAVIILTCLGDARDLTCSDVTQGSEDGMTTSINVGIDQVFATEYGRWHLYFSFSYFFFIYIIADQYSSALDNNCPVLSTSVQTFAHWSPFLSGFPFICCIRYQARGCLYIVYAVVCHIFVYLLIIVLCGRCEWHYISGECLTTDLVTLSRIWQQQLRNCELTPGPV